MMRCHTWIRLAPALLGASLCACSHGGPPPAAQEKNIPVIALNSPTFAGGAPIPRRFTCDGANVSPPLHWSQPPKGTKSLALTCDDPDAPAGDWTHWVLSVIPPTVTALAEAVPPMAALRDGSQQGRNSFGKRGYGGPCPPRGSQHRYFFRLYALDARVKMPQDATAAAAQEAMRGHIQAEGTLVGTYQRP